MMDIDRDGRGGTALRALLLLALILTGGAFVDDLRGYGRWAAKQWAAGQALQLRQVAGPTAPWLPGVLAATSKHASILLAADELTDADWLAAYYLYPRAVHVIPTRALSTPRAGEATPKADFLLREGRLWTWPGRQAVPLASGGTAGLPPGRVSARGIMALLLTAAAAVGWGACLLLFIAPPLLLQLRWTGRLGLALVAGLMGMGSAGFLAAFAGVAASWGLTLFLTLGGLAALWPGRRWLRRDAQAAGRMGGMAQRFLPHIATVAMGLLLVAGMARALGEPMNHWDERFQWSYKAKILLGEGGIGGPSFQDLDRPHLHRRYPLALPALEAQLARLAGGFTQERAVKGLFPFFFLGLLLTVHGALRQRLAPGPSALLTALLAVLPPLHLATRIQGGPIHTGFADLPLAAVVAALAVCLVPARGTGEKELAPAWAAAALFAGFAFAVKPEGVAFLAAALLVAAGSARRPSARPAPRQALTAVALLALLILPVVALHAAVPTVGTAGYSGDENYLARLAPAALAAGLRTNLATALGAMAAAPFTPRWAFYGLLPLAALLAVFFSRRPAPGSHLLAFLIALPLAADLLAFTLTGSEIRWHLAVALDRLILQVTPLIIILTGGLLARLDPGRRT